MLLFLETDYGRTDMTYAGEAMTPARADLAITIAQYKYFITDLVWAKAASRGSPTEAIRL